MVIGNVICGTLNGGLVVILIISTTLEIVSGKLLDLPTRTSLKSKAVGEVTIRGFAGKTFTSTALVSVAPFLSVAVNVIKSRPDQLESTENFAIRFASTSTVTWSPSISFHLISYGLFSASSTQSSRLRLYSSPARNSMPGHSSVVPINIFGRVLTIIFNSASSHFPQRLVAQNIAPPSPP